MAATQIKKLPVLLKALTSVLSGARVPDRVLASARALVEKKGGLERCLLNISGNINYVNP